MQVVKNKNNYYSIFNRFISLIFLVFISIIVCIGWKIGSINKNITENDLVYISDNVTKNISNIFSYNEEKFRFVAHLISEGKLEKDYAQISHLLKLLPADPKKQLVLWSYVAWADNNHISRLNNIEIFKTPVDLNYRPYMNSLAQNAFTLCFGQSGVSYITKRKVIPVAMGVKNQKGDFIGSINSGIDLENIAQYVKDTLKNSHINYALVNLLDEEVISRSDNFDYHPILSKDIKELIKDNNQRIYRNINKNKYVITTFPNIPFAFIATVNQKTLGYKEYFESVSTYKIELLAALLIIVGLIYLFYLSILDPFIALSDAALAISNGDASTPMPRNINSKEGALVANALEKIKSSLRVERSLVQELSTAHNKLSITNLRLENKVSKRTQELEQALEIKTSLLNKLSHEIRTPLQGVADIAEKLVSCWGELSESMRFELAYQISHHNKRFLTLVNNLIDVSALSEKDVRLSLSKVDLVALVLEIINECNMLYMHKKSITINFDQGNSIYVEADKERITQVLRNLFVNAIKSSSNNSLIGVKIVPTDLSNGAMQVQEAVHFIIHDQGVGVREESMAIVFSPVDSKTNDNYLIGLKICYEIISAHNGKIWATNNKDGGSTFNFVIPINQPKELLEDSNIIAYKDLDPNKINILLIDDEEVCLGSMDLLLHGSKYNLIKFNSGQAGLAYLQTNYNSISLIMLDLMMPDIYGLNVLAEIKSNVNLAKIPVMLQTGSSDEEEIVKAFNMGISCFIRKPYKKKVVLREIDKAIRLYSLNNDEVTPTIPAPNL